MNRPVIKGDFKKIEIIGKKIKLPIDKYKKNGYTSKAVKKRDLSSAGRASALQAEGHRFEPCRSHFINYYGGIAQLARAYGSYP